MNCHFPDAPEEGFTAVGSPRDSRIITQHGGRLPPHAPCTDTGTTGGGGGGACVVGGAVVGGAVTGGKVVGATVVGAAVVDEDVLDVLVVVTRFTCLVTTPGAAFACEEGPLFTAKAVAPMTASAAIDTACGVESRFAIPGRRRTFFDVSSGTSPFDVT